MKIDWKKWLEILKALADALAAPQATQPQSFGVSPVPDLEKLKEHCVQAEAAGLEPPELPV